MYFAQSSLPSEIEFTPDIQATRTWRSYQEASSYLDENLYVIADMMMVISMHSLLIDTMLGKLVQGRYQVVQILNAGGFCRTYLAQDTHRLGHPTCVVKHLLPANNDPESLQTLRRLSTREAQALKQLGDYDQVPQLYAHFEENQEFYLVREFIPGHPLSAELLPGHRWSESQVIQLLQEVLGILEFVHSHTLIHRDIKPSNLIRRQQDSRLVLIDFGSVKQAWTQVVTSQGKTCTSFAQGMPATIAIGTPGYMPPEQERGLPRPNSDIYALGMIGIQALTGLHPTQLLEDSDTGEVIWQHQAQVSADLASVLNKMVRYHFKDRYQSATEALQALQPLANLHPLPQHSAFSERIMEGVGELVLELRPEAKASHPRRARVSESSATVHGVIEVLPASSGSVLQDVQKPESSGSMIPAAAGVESFPYSACFQEQYSRLEEILKEIVGPIAPTLLRQVAAQASSPQAWVENLARYLPAHQLLELKKQLISLSFESTLQPQTKSSHAPSLKHQAITESFVQQCEQALANFIGPIATVLVQNALKSHPQISAAELVEILAAEIPDRQRAVEFHQHLQITQKLDDNESLKLTQNNQDKLEWLQATQRKAIALVQLLITPIKKRWSL